MWGVAYFLDPSANHISTLALNQPPSALAKVLSDAATSYVLRNARRPAEQQLPPIAFMVVDVDMAPRTFHEIFKFETVPHLIFFPVRAAACALLGFGWDPQVGLGT